jgi:ABC-2 type transport system ATP-binding protein
LIRIINQIIYPDAGRVFFNGEVLSSKHISQIGYMPEERGLYKSMKVQEQALYLGQLKGLSKADANRNMNEWLERLEIGDWRTKKMEELSKGMAQKVQFLVTVLHKPSLLIFDEPFSGFDPVNANLIKDQILYLKEQGTTIVFSTHRMESVEELCDSIALINHSEKILEGKVSDIKKQYKTNTYQIGIFPTNETLFLSELAQQYTYEFTDFNSIQQELKIQVQVNDALKSQELLAFLIAKGTVTHFSEKIPSINDIFIQAVNPS